MRWQGSHRAVALAGTDASEAFRAFKHPPVAYREMKNHCIGVMESGREGGEQASASAQQLILTRNSMEKAGLFKVDLWNYVILAAALGVAFVAVLMCVAARWVIPGALLMALFWQQVRSSLHEQLSAISTQCRLKPRNTWCGAISNGGSPTDLPSCRAAAPSQLQSSTALHQRLDPETSAICIVLSSYVYRPPQQCMHAMLTYEIVQLALVGHDVGHNQLFATRAQNSIMGIFVTLFLGAGVQWWKYNHNTHHVTPNSDEHDPDIQVCNAVLLPHMYSSFLWATESLLHGAALAIHCTSE